MSFLPGALDSFNYVGFFGFNKYMFHVGVSRLVKTNLPDGHVSSLFQIAHWSVYNSHIILFATLYVKHGHQMIHCIWSNIEIQKWNNKYNRWSKDNLNGILFDELDAVFH